MSASPSLAVRRRDRRRAGVLLTVAAVLAGGWAIQQWGGDTPTAVASPAAHTAPTVPQGGDAVRRPFDEAVVRLHARQYTQAVKALHQVLALAPEMPEAHVNMGYALLGLGRHAEARAFFDGATALKPDQANAYYGMALAWEAAGDLPMATGAMRSYLHLARDERPEHLSRARAALWEWEQAGTARR